MRNPSTGLRRQPPGGLDKEWGERETPTPSVPSASRMGSCPPQRAVAEALRGQPGGARTGQLSFPSLTGALHALAVGSFRSAPAGLLPEQPRSTGSSRAGLRWWIWSWGAPRVEHHLPRQHGLSWSFQDSSQGARVAACPRLPSEHISSLFLVYRPGRQQ